MGELSAGIEVTGLEKRFGHRTVLDLDFELGSGEFCVILGENGAGKSTFFRCLLALEPHGGSVRVAGGPPRGGIAGVLDEPMMYPSWTAAQYMRYAVNDTAATLRPVIARLVGQDLLGTRIGRLSTGQKKIVLLATVLAGAARFILLDEFANGLDQGARRRFREVVRDELVRGRSFIVTGHDLAAFADLPTRVLVLRHGNLVDVTVDYHARASIEGVYEKHVPRTDP